MTRFFTRETTMSQKKKSTYRYSFLALLLVAFAAFGADLEKGKPEDVGLSSSRLNRIEAAKPAGRKFMGLWASGVAAALSTLRSSGSTPTSPV